MRVWLVCRDCGDDDDDGGGVWRVDAYLLATEGGWCVVEAGKRPFAQELVVVLIVCSLDFCLIDREPTAGKCVGAIYRTEAFTRILLNNALQVCVSQSGRLA